MKKGFIYKAIASIFTYALVCARLNAQSNLASTHAVMYHAVVNVAELAAEESNNPLPSQNRAAVLNPSSPSAGYYGNHSGNSSNISRGTYTSTPSPVPSESFEAQIFDGYVPACPSGAVNENFVVSTAKYNLCVQNRTGTILNELNIYNFWSRAVPLNHIWQNRIVYDLTTQRWIIAAFCDEYTDTSGVLVGISQTQDPTGNWNLYKIIADTSGNTFADFATLGFNKNFIAVAATMLTQDSAIFVAENVFVFDKNAMMTDSGTVNCSVLGAPTNRITIASTYDSTVDELFVLCEKANLVGELELMKIYGNIGSEQISNVAYPTSNIPYGSQAGNADFAPQLGSSSLLQSSNDMPTSLVYMNGNLWASQTVFLPPDTPTRSSIQWWQIDPTGNILQLGLIDDSMDNVFLDYPSIAVNQYNDALIGYSIFSPQIYASSGYSYHDHNQAGGVTDSFYIFKAGLSTYYDTVGGSINWWGHFSATVVDPVDTGGFWTIQQFASNSMNTWGVWWAGVDNYTTKIVRTDAPYLDMKVFPNPGNGLFNLSASGMNPGNAELKIFDLLGNEVYSQQLNAVILNSNVSLNLAGLVQGLYIAQLKTASQTAFQRLLIQ